MKLLSPLVLSLMLTAALPLAACDQLPGRAPGPAVPADGPVPQPTEETIPEAAGGDLPVHPQAAASDTAIDWDAARRDLASRSPDSMVGAFQVASGEAAPPVPVFLPSAPVTAQSGEEGLRFQPLADGYFAFLPGERWDAVVNGTNRVMLAPGETRQPRSDTFLFQPTLTGAQVSFSRYGADYLVEFECKELTNGQPTCITADEAVAFAQDLVIAGTR
ncbi:hypothetical protein [Hyphomonas sp.]|uniref:hypothetical protein n=1 Tax=Hyphomonas sp. TaxID=87 RepID=UPI003918B841